MEYELLTEEAEHFVQALRERNWRNQTERFARPGFHESGILGSILHQTGLLDAHSRANDDPTLRFELGYSWEDMLGAHVFHEDAGVFKPGTLQQDGVLVTPDGFDEAHWEAHEYKATWTSMARPIRDRWYWLHQMRAECKVTGTQTSKLKVLFLCGDWRPPSPQVQVWRFHWKPWEIEQTWRMLLHHRDWLVQQGFDRI